MFAIIVISALFSGFVLGYMFGSEDAREDRLFGRMED